MQAFEENKHALDVTLEELERITEKQKKSNLITDFKKIEDVVIYLIVVRDALH